MAKRNGMTKYDSDTMEFLTVAGRKIPTGLAAKTRAVTKAMLLRKLNVGTKTRMKGAKLYGELKGGSPIMTNDPANRKALDALLNLHRSAANKKLPFPKVTAPFVEFPPGSLSFSGTWAPPFKFSNPDNPNSGNSPTFSSANTNGQIIASVVTPEKGASSNFELAQVGAYFSPPVAGTLTISTTPTYSFEELTNSLNTAPVEASGAILLTITPNGPGQGIEEFVQLYDYCISGQIQFDFEFDAPQPLSATLEVTPPLMYLCTVMVIAEASGQGWPGSLAVSTVTSTVPSISYAFTARPFPVK
jgi:hypothetical protein